MKSILFYIHDPMCSWCWAFKPCWKALRESLPEQVTVTNVVGGLAPDSDDPMPEQMRQRLQGAWQRIQQVVPGTEFNFDFWKDCAPRRSTYPSCRAVLTARHIDASFEEPMITAIQQAYYLQARNPSDVSTLVELAGEIGCDAVQFETLISSDTIEAQLQREFALTESLRVQGFPSLVLQPDVDRPDAYSITVDHNDAEAMLRHIDSLIDSA